MWNWQLYKKQNQKPTKHPKSTRIFKIHSHINEKASIPSRFADFSFAPNTRRKLTRIIATYQGIYAPEKSLVGKFVKTRQSEREKWSRSYLGRFYIAKATRGAEISWDKAHRANKAKAYIHTSSRSASRSNDTYWRIYPPKLFGRRNFVRQGKASEGNEAVVTYGDLTESKL